MLLLAVIAGVAVGGVAIQQALARLGADLERRFRAAPPLRAATFAEEVYGRVEGVLHATEPPILAPGSEAPCVYYELIVRHDGVPRDRLRRRREMPAWVDHERFVGGVDVVVQVDGVEVAIDLPEAVLVAGVTTDHRGDPRVPGQYAATIVSTVRALPPDARVRVVGTLTRDVDTRPEAAAAAGYRETPIRWRLTARPDRPLLIGLAP
ncbi:MAG: hypothetical protein K8W52_27210 [Deltaproteobacteria bacterium]|nr:hypothetical protein [Deltaproteobacteria bacterium]